MIYMIYICISRPARHRQYFSANTVGLQHAALRSSQRWVGLCTALDPGRVFIVSL